MTLNNPSHLTLVRVYDFVAYQSVCASPATLTVPSQPNVSLPSTTFKTEKALLKEISDFQHAIPAQRFFA